MQDTLDLARQLLEIIQSCEEEDRYRGHRDQLYGLGPEIIPLLREELQSVHYRRRMAAATNLGRLGDTASVTPLTLLLNDPQSGVREMALFGLGLLGDTSATDAILNTLNDYDADVRYRALVALSDLGYPHIEDVLIRASSDEAYGVREQALSQLRNAGTPRAIVAILRGLLEREHEMQQMAEEALDRLVPKLTREHYKKIQEQLTPRERRLILNYLEARNLQEVYVTLWQRLQLVARPQSAQRGLDKYGRLLNSPDERKYLKRAYLRDDSVSMLVEHFTDPASTKSVLLIGDAGSGKTAIIHEMALKLMEREDEDWQILETNTSELISGTRYLGDWETKLKEMTEAILKHDRVILYITNPDDLLGAGAHSKSDENFADFFKPYLQRGQLRMIAECTEEHIKGGLSRDPGFLRQFRQVNISTMDDAQTLDVLTRRLADARATQSRPVAAEAGCLDRVVDFARSFHTRTGSPGRACDLLDALIDYAGRKAERHEEVVTLRIEQIPPCLSETTGISLDLLDDTIPLDLDATGSWFQDRLIDQDHAIDTIVDRLAMVKTGMVQGDKPLGVYFLVGPTGVGKTYFAKLVAQRLFGDPKRMLRFDLSEYRGRFAIEKLIGSPHEQDREGLLTEAVRNQPFTVLLFDEFEKADPEIYNLFLQILDEGRLTDARGRTTDFRQAIIFLTSNLGASRTSIAPLGFGQQEEGRKMTFEGHINSKLDEFFAPEFLNRLDDIIVFNPLSPRAMRRLVDLELQQAFERRGFSRHKLRVKADDAAVLWLEEQGFSERFGARALKRAIERHVLTPISRLLVRDRDTYQGRTILLTARDGQLAIELADAKSAPPTKAPLAFPKPLPSTISTSRADKKLDT
jgi:ATP-dependent Clp protease ATP-binding subunit ClpC